jgi:hypothetical protein
MGLRVKPAMTTIHPCSTLQARNDDSTTPKSQQASAVIAGMTRNLPLSQNCTVRGITDFVNFENSVNYVKKKGILPYTRNKIYTIFLRLQNFEYVCNRF